MYTAYNYADDKFISSMSTDWWGELLGWVRREREWMASKSYKTFHTEVVYKSFTKIKIVKI